MGKGIILQNEKTLTILNTKCYVKIMFGLGVPELIIILVIIFVIFGAGKLPEIGGAIGKGINSFKKATKDADAIDVTPQKDDKNTDKPSQ